MGGGVVGWWLMGDDIVDVDNGDGGRNYILYIK